MTDDNPAIKPCWLIIILGTSIPGLVFIIQNDDAANTCGNGLWEAVAATVISNLIHATFMFIGMVSELCCDLSILRDSALGKFWRMLTSIVGLGIYIWLNVAFWTLVNTCKDMYVDDYHDLYMYTFVVLLIGYSAMGLVCCCGTIALVASSLK